MQITPLFRQVLVAVSPQLAAFSVGGAVTYPSVLIEHYRHDNSTIQLDLNRKSWIGSMYGMSGIPVVLMPILTQILGRKFGYIMACSYVVIGWILTYNAHTFTEILVSEFFHGLGINCLLPVSFLGMSEMLAPKYRLISMQAFGIAQCLGMATSGILGKFFHFRVVALVMFIPIVTAITIALVWPESPSWFACKGEFDKCIQAFIKLRGTSEEAVKELNELIAAQKENVSERNVKIIKAFRETVTSRDFYIPLLHIFIILNMMYWSGADVVIIYFMEMASRSTDNENTTFYAAIVMYVIVVVFMTLADVLVAKFKNKTVLLTSTTLVVVFLLAAFVITGLQSLGVLESNSMLCVYCLLLCIASGCSGLNSLVFIIGVELMPVKHRSIGGALYIVINCCLYASSQKLSPYLFQYVGLCGSFLIYAVNGIVCALFVWKFVPETKRRSLQEIEDYYMYGKFIDREVCDEVRPITGT